MKLCERHAARLKSIVERRRGRGDGPMYRNLIAWQKAMILVGAVYDVTAHFPREEAFGLTSQLRRATVSVQSNLAEGQGRRTLGETAQFLGNARGSLLEAEGQLIAAEMQHYINAETADELLDLTQEILRLINGLLHKKS